MLNQLLNCNPSKNPNRYTTSDLKKHSKFDTYQMCLFGTKFMDYGRRKHPSWSDLKYFSRMRMWYVHRGFMFMFSWFMKLKEPMTNYGLLTENEYKALGELQKIIASLIANRHEEYVKLKQDRFIGTSMVVPENGEEIYQEIAKQQISGLGNNLLF